MPFRDSLATFLEVTDGVRRILIDVASTLGSVLEFYTGNVLETQPGRLRVDSSQAYPPLDIASPDLGSGVARLWLQGLPTGLGTLAKITAGQVIIGGGIAGPLLYVGSTGLCAWRPAFPGSPGNKLATAEDDAGAAGIKPIHLKVGTRSGNSSAGGVLTVSFGVPFENACIGAVITAGSISAAAATSPNARAVNFTPGGFQIGGVVPSTAMTFSWLAFGY